VKLHRAIVLVAMMLLAVGALALLVADAGGKSIVALAVVIVVAAIAGIAFSWKRYFQPPVK
jgi:preprotein translocase subunit SecF